MQYSPRKRAKRPYPRVRSWPESEEPTLLGFAGYKAGMTHMLITDHRKDTGTSNKPVFTPVTIIDCPPITPFAVRAYKDTSYGLEISGELWSDNISKDLKRKINFKKTPSSQKNLAGDRVSLLVHTSPKDSSTGSKTPEVFECHVGGKTFEEKLNYAKELLGKPVRVTDIFKSGEYIDVVAVSTGKGYQGPVKRFGIHVQPRKQRVAHGRHVGTLGNRSHATRWTVPMAGQMGYNTRTEYNKTVLKLGDKGEEMTPKGGFVGYGVVRGDYVAIKGSVPGPAKRLIRFRPAMRTHPEATEPDIVYVSLTSKQKR